MIYAALMPTLQYLLVTREVELTMRRVSFWDDYLPRVTCANATEQMRMACKAQLHTQCYFCDTSDRAKDMREYRCDHEKDYCATRVLGVLANGERVGVPEGGVLGLWG